MWQVSHYVFVKYGLSGFLNRFGHSFVGWLYLFSSFRGNPECSALVIRIKVVIGSQLLSPRQIRVS